MKPRMAIRSFIILGLALAWGSAGATAWGQATSLPASEPEESPASSAVERYKELTDPERMLDKRKKATEKSKPPYEFFRSQVLPFDVLPYVKANHWNTMTLEMQANLNDYSGILQSAPVPLLDMPHEIVFRRDARLIQEQKQRVAFQVMFPHVSKILTLELTRPDAIRAEGAWDASLMRMEPHQMLVPVLCSDPAAYTPLSRFMALIPASGDKDANAIDRQRYYRLVQSQNSDKPPALSTHPLTWTAISHVIWDGVLPEALNIGQQEAMLDWLHWGGQLIIVGGAGPSLAPLQESFLAPYLPARESGKNVTLHEADLAALTAKYPQPVWPGELEQMNEMRGGDGIAFQYRYRDTLPIRPGTNKSVFLTGLTPNPGATVIPLGGSGEHVLGVEQRVGRGRILMLAVKPIDPVLLKWPGIDNLVRRVILRRPEEGWEGAAKFYRMMSGRELSWLRYVSRDLGAPTVEDPAEQQAYIGEVKPVADPVAAWIDAAVLPVQARKALQKASGLTVPSRDFVLRVVLAYVIALVPLNWLVCRFLLRRRELAWVVVPLLAFGFAIAVERAAAYDMGFDSACDEIDVLEIQGDYPRGHLSRFAAVYSTGRVRYTISYPNNPSALALPLSMENQLRGEEALQSIWQSSPEPALMGFPVQPRSLAMFRAEEMVNLQGGITLESQGGARQLVNATGLPLRDAVLVDVSGKRRYTLGKIDGNAKVPLGPPDKEPETESPERSRSDSEKPEPPPEWLMTNQTSMAPRDPFLETLRSYDWRRPEDAGEWRLVAWTDQPHPGQNLEPAVDRHRGFRLVVAHLTYGPPPSPDVAPFFDGSGPRLSPDARATDAGQIPGAEVTDPAPGAQPQ